jgi:hypothetical protein
VGKHKRDGCFHRPLGHRNPHCWYARKARDGDELAGLGMASGAGTLICDGYDSIPELIQHLQGGLATRRKSGLISRGDGALHD